MFKLAFYKTKQDNEIVICSGEDYINLFSLLNDIKFEWDSMCKGAPTRFLFDLFLTNGNDSNRFAYLDYDGQNFINGSYRVVSPDEIESELLEMQNCKYIDYA
ncbi:type II toxin-antitoxin system RnlB family antitoxin [uncultured Psychrobacter sp.]|uniref:type II toxin-antitoxin system RnlB family antitoxin n=1 Tax=Psychrobacter saeujeotis TaxID=3143436 RepID=UPI00345E030E